MKLLLTGGTGFLGSALARYWAVTDAKIMLLMRRDSDLRKVGIPITSSAVLRPESDRELTEGIRSFEPDVIVHTACSYGRQGETLQDVLDANVRLGLALMDASSKFSNRVTFLNAGSALEGHVNSYALSKKQFSDWGTMLAGQLAGRMQFVDVALQHFYGPNDSPSKFTTHVIRSCRDQVSELSLTAGEQKRDFIYIDDVVSAFDILVRARGDLNTVERIDVGTGEAPTVRRFAETVRAVTQSQTNLLFGALPYRQNEAMNCRADTRRMRSLGWVARHGLTEGIARTVELEMKKS
ncbi:NAD(P)-dependent oxidoreductase [Caenimonas sedimenti]|uniref:NAD(P)-dependent oxidoreductase n=1 Tax=Caenimonas sedimenti TaxID=2596921 RepID=A0A562ZUM4_9BURK|nr:NAD(P)-dependent oxidoreductase [Caenimonas sedimenti]TWO72299.1 NAD(P)-dependent oxidoreductase [Caenimonas sedimenti]